MSSAKSVIISCAGIGSRLGLATTKALINIDGKSLIRWQLELFKDIDDRYNSKDNQAHEDAYKNKQGYEWVTSNFS